MTSAPKGRVRRYSLDQGTRRSSQDSNFDAVAVNSFNEGDSAENRSGSLPFDVDRKDDSLDASLSLSLPPVASARQASPSVAAPAKVPPKCAPGASRGSTLSVEASQSFASARCPSPRAPGHNPKAGRLVSRPVGSPVPKGGRRFSHAELSGGEGKTVIAPIQTKVPRRSSEAWHNQATELSKDARITFSSEPPKDPTPERPSSAPPVREGVPGNETDCESDALTRLVAESTSESDSRELLMNAINDLLDVIQSEADDGCDVTCLLSQEFGPAMLARLQSRPTEQGAEASGMDVPRSARSEPNIKFQQRQEEMKASKHQVRSKTAPNLVNEQRKDQDSLDASRIVRMNFIGKVYNGLQMDGSDISFLGPGNMLHKKEVKPWWRIIAVDSEAVSDYDEFRAAVDSRRDLPGRGFKITFLADPASAAAHQDRQRKLLFKTLRNLKKADEVDLFFLEQERAEVLTDKVSVFNLLSQQRVHEMEVLLGNVTAAEMEQFLELLAFLGTDMGEEVRRVVAERCQTLAMRDADGLTAVHYAKSNRCLEMLLKSAPPGIASKRDSSGKTAAQVALSRESSMGAVFLENDICSLLGVDWEDDGRCGGMYLEADTLDSFERALPSWERWAAALENDAEQLLEALEEQAAKVIELRIDGGSKEDMAHRCIVEPLHFCFFGERSVWEKGVHSARSSERLKKVEACVVNLFGELVDKEEAVKPLKLLMQATKGPKHAKLDPREPWRDALEIAVASCEMRTRAILDAAFEDLMAAEGVDWLSSLEDVLFVPGLRLRNDSQAPGCPIWKQPEWVWEQDFDSALKDLNDLGLFNSPLAVSTFTKQVGTPGPGLERLDRHEATFMRLHALQRRELCQVHVNGIRDWFALFSSKYSCTCSARKIAKKIDRILIKASINADEAVSSGADVPHHELQTAGDYVCDINGVELVASDLAGLHDLYRGLSDLRWDKDGAQLVRVKNGFHRSFPTDSGYRDLKTWVLVDIASLPLTVEVQLHLHAFHRMKHGMHVAYEYRRGSFDHDHVQPGCPERSRMLLRLREVVGTFDELLCSPHGMEDAVAVVADLENAVRQAREAVAEIMGASVAQNASLLNEVSKVSPLLVQADAQIVARRDLHSVLSGEQLTPETTAASTYRQVSTVIGNAESCGVECTEARSELDQLEEVWRRETELTLKSAQDQRLAVLEEALRDAKELQFEAPALVELVQAAEARKQQQAPMAKTLNDKLMNSLDDPAAMKTLIWDSADPNFMNERGRSVFHHAIQSKRVQAVAVLLETRADPNLSGKSGNTPLHAIAQMASDTTVMVIAEMIMQASGDVNGENGDGWRPLHFAVMQRNAGLDDELKHNEIASLLLGSKASVNKKLPNSTQFAGSTPLHLAVETGNDATAILLLRWKAKVDSRNGCGNTSLRLAVNRGDVSLAAQLLEAGADACEKDEGHNTLLHHLALAGHAGLTDMLVKFKADINARNGDGLSSLAIARENSGSAAGASLIRELEKLGGR